MIYNLYDNMISQIQIDIPLKFKNIYLNICHWHNLYIILQFLCVYQNIFILDFPNFKKVFATLLCVGICMTIAIYLTFKMNCGMIIKTRVLQITMIICCICSRRWCCYFYAYYNNGVWKYMINISPLLCNEIDLRICE